MSDATIQVRRGGGFTFVLALLAFAMSATALYQVNKDVPFVKNIGETFSNQTERLTTMIEDWRSGAGSASGDRTPGGVLDDIRERLRAYVEKFGPGGSEEGSSTAAQRLEQLEVELKKATDAVKRGAPKEEIDKSVQRLRTFTDELESERKETEQP